MLSLFHSQESDDLKRKFEEEFEKDPERLYEYLPQAFRWTCCGTDASMDWGCDHHGVYSNYTAWHFYL